MDVRTTMGRRGILNRLLALALFAVPLAILVARPAVAASDGTAPDAPLNERVLYLPGDPTRPVILQVTLLHPDGPGPFPLAVMNHGATNASASNRGQRYQATYAAYYFLSRGYAVALPMMRGFAGSGGNIESHGCDLAADAINNAKDIRAVIDDLAKQPGIDTRRVVVAGQSFGGWNTLGVGAIDDPRVKGLIVFSPGVRSSDCTSQDAGLITSAADLGAHTKIPSLWFYGENDALFPTGTWRAMYRRFNRAGGAAELVDYGRFKTDSHQMLAYRNGLAIWTPKADEFLGQIDMPAEPVHPEYLPAPSPRATYYAPIDDIAAVPYLGDRGQDVYRAFLRQPSPRAFAVSPTGSVASSSGGYDPLRKALSVCEGFGAPCQLYAVNDDVVWTKSAEDLQAQLVELPLYRKVVAAGTTTRLDFSYRINPDCSSRGLAKIQLTQTPEHGTVQVGESDDYPGFPADHPMAACDKVKVAGVAIDYTPANGFTGLDLLSFQESNLEHRQIRFRVAITVK